MSMRWVRGRKLTVGQREFVYSVIDHPEDQELRIYRKEERVPAWILRLSYPETWAIDLFRPKTAALVIEYAQTQGWNRPAQISLKKETALREILLHMPERKV